MALSVEFMRHLDAARAARETEGSSDTTAEEFLAGHMQSLRAAVRAGIVHELPVKVNVSGRTEPLVLPTSDQLITTARAELDPRFFGENLVIPEPPAGLFRDLERLAQSGITETGIYYTPGRVVTKDDYDRAGWVKPEDSFWQRLAKGEKYDGYPSHVAELHDAWFIELDPLGKPSYEENGQQMYGIDGNDYLAPYMVRMRERGMIETYEYARKDGRAGASPVEIEKVIVPVFAIALGAEGILRHTRYIEHNVGENMKKRQATNTADWFSDDLSDAYRLFGGRSVNGGPAGVRRSWSDDRFDSVGFSLVLEHPSQPQAL